MNTEALPRLINFESIEFIDNVASFHEDKYKFLYYLLSHFLKNTSMEENLEHIWDNLKKREKLVSTGIGLGVAIPYCFSKFVEKPHLYLAIIPPKYPSVDFQAIDEESVRIIILILLPETKYGKDLKLLTSIASVMNNQSLRKKILKEKDKDKIKSIIEKSFP